MIDEILSKWAKTDPIFCNYTTIVYKNSNIKADVSTFTTGHWEREVIGVSQSDVAAFADAGKLGSAVVARPAFDGLNVRSTVWGRMAGMQERRKPHRA
jgi:hypothetical protein